MPRSPAALVAVRYESGSAVAAVAVASVWHLVNDVPGIIWHWTAYRSTTAAYASAVMWAVYSVVGTAAAVLVLRGRRSRWFEGLGLGVLLLGVPVVVATCPPALTFGSADWAWGMFGWYALLLLWRRPVSFLLGASAANGGAALAAIALTRPVGRVELSSWGMVVYGTSVLPIVFAVGARLLARDAARTSEAAAAIEAAATRRLVAQAVHTARQRRYQKGARSAIDLLVGLSTGMLDPTDPDTRRRAAIEAARLRRLLAEHDDVPDPLVHELRASADLAERRGVAVDLATVGRIPLLPVRIRQALTEAPLHVLTAARTYARITVAGSPLEVSVGVVANADLDRLKTGEAPDVTVGCQQQGEELCLQTMWRAPSPSPSSTTIPSSSKESNRGSRATRSSVSRSSLAVPR